MIADRHRHHLIIDIIGISISIVLAILLARSGFIEQLLTGKWILLESFIAGLFFTSAFTTAPAIAALGEIAQNAPSVWHVALAGGLGALVGDLIIFRIMRDRLEQDIYYALGRGGKMLHTILKVKLFRWITFFLGALIIASPLPDELGLMMMGLSRERISIFIPTSFIFNSLGIFIIGIIARSLL